MVKEKTVETCSLTVREILDMKRAGLSEATLQAIITERSFMKHAAPTVYGERLRSVRFVTVEDIIRLKDAGVSEETIRTVLGSGTESTERDRRRKALEMLRDSELHVDTGEKP